LIVVNSVAPSMDRPLERLAEQCGCQADSF
jgi:hypothetical protein